MRASLGQTAIRGGLAAAVVVMATYCAFHLRLESDLTHFMPEGSHSELAAISRHLADSQLTRTMVLTIEAEKVRTAIAAAKELATRLRASPEVAWVRHGFDPRQLEALYQLYFPRRH